ncbi:uncharacterized protein [Antedon mediterranea]|uniref:uncharacterized protein n=1 Tax=Antedon mediterranea TaxID=105859 RepID=UPI003AF60984
MLPSGQLQIFLGQEMISKQTFNNTNLKESALFDVFTSVNIVPNWKHDGLSLSCIVNQPQISDIEVESRHIELEIIIEFYHNARLDRGYNASEGDDVILNCSSNYPYAATYTWKHVESGKTINGRILNYTDIHCDAAGDYTCTVDPEKDRSSANVTTCISMTCLIPQEPLYVRIVRRYKGRIIIEWSPPIHWQYTQYIVEWKGKSGELIEHHPLPILDNDPPFNFTIEDENIESIYWIGVYGKTGKTKSNYNAISVIKESTSATPGATPNCNNMYYDDDAFNIPISIIAVSSVTLFVAGCLTSMCLSKTMRRIRRKARAKSATAVSHSSTYMHYLPNEEEDTTYQDLCDVDNNEMSSYENIDNSVYKTQSIIKSCTTVAENIEPVYESTT